MAIFSMIEIYLANYIIPFPQINTTIRSKFPIPWKRNLDRSAVQNSPFVEGVATEGRRGSVGNTR